VQSRRSVVPPLYVDGRNHNVQERWYVVQAQLHGERRAAFHLGQQSFRAFLPLYRKTVRHARQFVTVEAPFFPRYLFVRLDLGRDRWRSVNSTFGVASLIMGGDLPKPVPAGVVEGILATTSASGLVSSLPRLLVGDSVRIVSGPLAGLVGTLSALDENQRVKVLLDILGKETLVAIDASRMTLVPAT
jgi:transcription elongation factor/antiterminator RfaH